MLGQQLDFRTRKLFKNRNQLTVIYTTRVRTYIVIIVQTQGSCNCFKCSVEYTDISVQWTIRCSLHQTGRENPLVYKGLKLENGSDWAKIISLAGSSHIQACCSAQHFEALYISFRLISFYHLCKTLENLKFDYLKYQQLLYAMLNVQ